MSAPSFLHPPGRPSTVATLQQARELAAWILDGDRLRPLVVLTVLNNRPTPYFDPTTVQPLVGDAGDVVVIDQHREHAYTRELQRELPPGLNVFNGAARIYWPTAAAGTDPKNHPLIRAESDDSTDAAKRGRLANRWRAGPPRRPVGRPVRAPALQGPTPGFAALVPEGPSDSTEDLLYVAITRAYLRLLGPEQRDRFPLRAHRVHHDLAEQLAVLEPARAPVADAAVGVLSGHVWTRAAPVPERVLRDGRPVLRDDDQAVAWRCPLDGSDRHLLYWQPAHGPIELARIAEVDYIREPASRTATSTPAATAMPAPKHAAGEETAPAAGRARGSFTIADERLAGALRAAGRPLMVSELRAALQIPDDVSADVLRRVLDRARDRGVITRTGIRRGTRYGAS